MFKTIERLFISAQISLLGGAALAFAFGDRALLDALFLLSLFFGGAAAGSACYSSTTGKEGTRGIR